MCHCPGFANESRGKKDHRQISQGVKDPYNDTLLKDPLQSKFEQHTLCSVFPGLLLADGCKHCLKSLRPFHLLSDEYCKNVHYLPGQPKDILQKLILTTLVLHLHFTTREKLHKVFKPHLLLCLQALCLQFSRKHRGLLPFFRPLCGSRRFGTQIPMCTRFLLPRKHLAAWHE